MITEYLFFMKYAMKYSLYLTKLKEHDISFVMYVL